MARVVCPCCKTGFEAKISRHDYAINCVSCGIAFNAAAYLPPEEFQARAERRPPAGATHAYDRGTQALGNVIRPIPPIEPAAPASPETKTGGLPFLAEEVNDAVEAVEATPTEIRLAEERVRASHPPLKKEGLDVRAGQARETTPPLSPPVQEGNVAEKPSSPPSSILPGSDLDTRTAPVAHTPSSFLEASTTTARFRAETLQRNAAAGYVQEEPPTAVAQPVAPIVPARPPKPQRPQVDIDARRQTAARAPVFSMGAASGTTPPANAETPAPNAPASAILPPIKKNAPSGPLEAARGPDSDRVMHAPARAQVPAAKPPSSGERPAVTPPPAPAKATTSSGSRRRPLLEGTFGPYEIEGEIARGGVGAVFRAKETSSGRRVALKVLLDGDEAGEMETERFRRECETAKALSLPGMVQIYAVGEIDAKPFMAMELVEGRSLDKLIPEKSLSVNDCLVMMQSVADTVGALHEAGYVHRDLKPANILLGPYGAPKVADFGLVKSLDEVTRLTASGLVCGTPAYMAPEQARGDGKAIDPRSDVWALGAVLYEMLTATPPFQADNALRLMLKITKDTPKPPRQMNPKVPRDVDAIVMKCLEKNAERRYPNGRAMAEDIKRFLEGLPVEARSNQGLTRYVKAVEANRGVVIAVAGGLAAVVVVAVLARIAFAPPEAGPLAERGWTSLDQNRIADAETEFRQALKLDPKQARASLGLGKVLGLRSINPATRKAVSPVQFQEALDLTSKAAELDKNLEASAATQTAVLYMWVGAYQDEARWRERAVALDSLNPDSRQALAMAYWNAGAQTASPAARKQFFEQAVLEFGAVLRLRQDYPKTREYIKQLQERFLASPPPAAAAGRASVASERSH
ncbi:MAG: protein kinase [Planctomycetes bacterium]|nr:protein kinase [Planctomycetota bacterium]